MIKQKEKDVIITLMELHMKVNGKQIDKKVKERKHARWFGV